MARKPKLFFVSTSSTTTTLQTASLCYATSGAPTGTCTGRKRRSINIEGVPLADVKPSQLNQGVQSSQEAKLDREGRFLLYWITTTSISTSTSYTTTIKISAATCTPAVNIDWSICWYSTKLIMLFLFVLFDWYIFWNPWHIPLFLLIGSLFNVGLANIDREFYKGCLIHFCLDIGVSYLYFMKNTGNITNTQNIEFKCQNVKILETKMLISFMYRVKLCWKRWDS